MNQNELVNKYNQLVANYKKVTDLNEKIKKQNYQLKQLNKQYKLKIDELEQEIYHISTLNDNEMTLKQFKIKYLSQSYDAQDMPKKAGIYAYFNTKTSQLYIGQSVNMYNRLKQHFRRGSLKIDGHDSEFSNESDWKFYVLEYIPRNDKKRLDEREAYWIALGKVAVSDKQVYDTEGVNKFIESMNDPSIKSRDIQTSQIIEGQGELTNRTRGNNVRM